MNAVKRAVRSIHPRIDKAISNFDTQFKEIKSSLESHTTLDTAIQVCKIVDTVQHFGMLSLIIMNVK